ncbi:hypothetical protein HDU97_005204 [Phlyctochytrium planicorne]|nr:hypothetical protein HDU97_005204 [Phlyctochytrium planicorne]
METSDEKPKKDPATTEGASSETCTQIGQEVEIKIPTEADYIAKVLSSNTVTSVGNYVLGKTLGEGSFGKVKLGTHRLTGQEVAIKIVDKIHAPSVVREIETWRHLHHPNIAQLYEVLTTETKIYMVTELCSGGEAFDYICENKRLEDRNADTRRIFREIVEAVGYCHDKNVVHRDLKLENILLTDELTVKLIDFGFTREFSDRDLLDTYCGSVAYAAPGVILFTLTCGYLPFDDDNEALVHRKIVDLDFEIPDFLADVTKDLIKKILILDASDRISISGILSHPWFLDDNDPSIPSPTATPKTPLGSTPEEAGVVSHLEALGMDVEGILASVQSNACDQASALWYLLLSKHRSPTTSSSPGPKRSSEALKFMLSGTSSNASNESGSGGLPTLLHPNRLPGNVNMEQYLENARRRKSMPAEIGTLNMSEMGLGNGMTGGRRGVMMEAMRAGNLGRVRNNGVTAKYGRRAMGSGQWPNGSPNLGGGGPPWAANSLNNNNNNDTSNTTAPRVAGNPLVAVERSRGGSGASSPCGSDSGSLNGIAGATSSTSAAGGGTSATSANASSATSASFGMKTSSSFSAKVGSRQILEESEGEDAGTSSDFRRYAPVSGGLSARLRTGSLKPTSPGMVSPADSQARSPVMSPNSGMASPSRPRAPGSAGSIRKSSEPLMVDLKSRPKSAVTGTLLSEDET